MIDRNEKHMQGDEDHRRAETLRRKRERLSAPRVASVRLRAASCAMVSRLHEFVI